MRNRFLSLFLPLLALLGLTAAVGFIQSEEKLEAVALNKMIQGLGYETKALNVEAGKEKYEFKITKGGLDIPIAIEVSPSKNYCWLTIFFGEAPKAAEASGAKMHTLLSWNGKIQPCQFYITEKGSLLMGYALENRNLTPAMMRKAVDKIVDDAVRSQDAWKDAGK